MEQPNATGDEDAPLTVRFWVLVVLTGIGAGLFGVLLMILLFGVSDLAFGPGAGTGSFEAEVAAALMGAADRLAGDRRGGRRGGLVSAAPLDAGSALGRRRLDLDGARHAVVSAQRGKGPATQNGYAPAARQEQWRLRPARGDQRCQRLHQGRSIPTGTTTELVSRFSTVAGEQGSPDTWRDLRGFAIKFPSFKLV
jgi:hypothetical protein